MKAEPEMRTRSPFIWIAFWLLFALHHDVWFWGDRTLVGGVIPVGLAYHVGFSLVAAGLWWAATRWAWPHDLEAWADDLHVADTKEPRA